MTASRRSRPVSPIVIIGAIAVVVALEALAAVALLGFTGSIREWFFWLGHGLASLGAAVTWYGLPASYRAGPIVRRGSRGLERWLGYGLLSLLILVLPVFGIVGLLVAIIPALYWPAHTLERDWRRIAIPDLPLSPRERKPGSHSTMRSLAAILDDSNSSVDARMNAVLALGRLPNRDSVPVLRSALGDPVDDVRLLAYAMLARRDDGLHGQIQGLERALADDSLDGDEKRALRYALAHLYWELCYTGLTAGSVAERVLRSAEKHARAVLARDADEAEDGGDDHGDDHGDDGGDSGDDEMISGHLATRVLLGRILLQRGDLDGAEEALAIARESGFPALSINPLLAEIAFYRGNFAEVGNHLEYFETEQAERSDIIGELCQFWLGKRA